MPSTWTWIDTLNAFVRPFVTYIFFTTFILYKTIVFGLAIHEGSRAIDVLPIVWDAPTSTLLSTVISFWFGTRSMDKYYPQPCDANTVFVNAQGEVSTPTITIPQSIPPFEGHHFSSDEHEH